MIKINDIIEVQAQKLVWGGKTLCRYGEDNFVVFVEDALPQEKLKVKVTSLNKHFAHAKIVEIINSSDKRIKPYCPIYSACGACEYQICDYSYFLELKYLVLKEIFPDIEVKAVIKSPKIQGYRNKIQYPSRRTKNSKRMLLGYFKKNTHDITDIKFCPNQSEDIDEIAKYIRQNFEFSCYDEKTQKGFLKNVLIRKNLAGKMFLVFVVNKDEYKNELDDFAKNISNDFDKIEGIFVNLNPSKTNKILSSKTIKIYGSDYIIEKLKDKQFKIGATSFFQVNPLCAIRLFDVVKENVCNNSVFLDCYGGVGAISVWVSDLCKKIVLIEENKEATKLAKENYELNNIKNYEIIEADARKYLDNLKEDFTCVVLDPPRAGCSKEGLVAVSKRTNKIIYVSCNPQTLRRDIDILRECGFEAQNIQPVDMFPYTHHIECVCVLIKQQKSRAI
ncbi:23S rRNA (uracil(1939)-C(5))-methyltransferase RlmD [bacterium]|nr:23S rRNA (uracil(1939)-C(5))-methyltransferase RlmD [bacterium]